MPERAGADRLPPARRSDPRTPVERAADHAALEHLADSLLPALVAKLGATGLGELEVREGAWRVRLRRAPGVAGPVRRGTERPSRAQPGHEGHGHGPVAHEERRARDASARNGHERGEPITAQRLAGGAATGSAEEPRVVATSPTVGVFRPGLAPGARVRAGDRVAIVDLLGLPQDVLSPIDGIVGATLVEAGDGVEYGEPLVEVRAEPASGPGAGER